MALKISQIREMPAAELGEKVSAMKAELAKEKALTASGTKSENPGKTKALRRTIAKMLTIINERSRAGKKSEAGGAEGKAGRHEKKTKGEKQEMKTKGGSNK